MRFIAWCRLALNKAIKFFNRGGISPEDFKRFQERQQKWANDVYDQTRPPEGTEIEYLYFRLQRHSYGCDLVTTMLEPAANVRF